MASLPPILNNPPSTTGGGNPSLVLSYKTVIGWNLAPGCPVPDYFEVILYTGSNPALSSSWLTLPAVQVNPAVAAAYAVDNSLSQTYGLAMVFTVPTTLSGPVSPAVRSVYGNGAMAAVPTRVKPLPPQNAGGI